MGLTQRTLRELRAELVNLQRHRGAIDEQIQGIELILSARSGDTAAARTNVRTDGSGVALVAVGRQKRATRGSLRKELTEMLRGTPGLKAAELADRLHREGFRIGGATGLRERVSHELSRLRRLNIVQRRPGGRYKLMTPKAKDAPTAPQEQSSAEATA